MEYSSKHWVGGPSILQARKRGLTNRRRILFRTAERRPNNVGIRTSINSKNLLGWIVSGKYTQQRSNRAQVCSVTVHENIGSLDSLVECFWSKADYTAEQVACEQHFERTVHSLSSGRFEVKLPFKRDPSILFLSFETEKRRFLALERRLATNNELHDMYQKFMREYLNLGHMSFLPTPPPGPHLYSASMCPKTWQWHHKVESRVRYIEQDVNLYSIEWNLNGGWNYSRGVLRNFSKISIARICLNGWHFENV